RRQPHIVPSEVPAELTPRRVDGGDRVVKLRGLHLPGVLVDFERHRLERLRTNRASAPLRVALEPQIETEEPHVRHASHRAEAVELRALFRDLMTHAG